MKKYILALIILFTGSVTFAQDASRDINTIDAQDSVVFDLSNAIEASGYVEFPVYFISNDTINAVDFSMKYNTTDFVFDTIIKLAGYLQITSNLAIDTTLYYTSYSLQTITNDTPLVKVRFTNLTGAQFCASDLSSVIAYLNGDVCSVKIVDCIPSGIADADYNKIVTRVYPNPVTENAVIEFSLAVKSQLTISVHDITGKTIYETNPSEYLSGPHKVNLNLSQFESGLYIVHINSGGETQSTRISVIR